MNNYKLVSIVLLLVIAFLSFELILEIGKCRRGFCAETFPEKVLSKEISHEKPLSYFSVIEKRNLFNVSKQPELRSAGSSAIPGFRLRGTMILESGGGYAILENLAAGVQKLHMLGDKVGGLKLVSVEWERVILRGSGGEKVIAMVSPRREELSPLKTLKKVETVETVRNKRIIPRSLVESAAANANQILTQVRIRPHLVSGISEGYWIGNIQPGSIVEEIGFQNGDVIKKVNGEVLDSPEKIFRAYQEIQETGAVVVDVERNNGIVSLTYEIRD